MPTTDSAKLISDLIEISRFYGADRAYVLAGGGNTSVKIGDRLHVKASGHALASIAADGFVELDRVQLDKLLASTLSSERMEREEQFKRAIMASRLAPERGQRPSVEALLHHLMPRQFVVHTHCTQVNFLTCCSSGKALSQELLGDEHIWIPEVDPGFQLAQTLVKALADFKKKTGRDCPRAVLMQNHGLVVAGETIAEVKSNTEWLLKAIAGRIAQSGSAPAFGAVSSIAEPARTSLINTIAPALRGLLGDEAILKIVQFSDSEEVLAYVGGGQGKEVALAGPLTPDQIVYAGSVPLWIDPPTETLDQSASDKLVDSLRASLEDYRKTWKTDPRIVLARGLGMFAIGDDVKSARTAREIYTDSIRVMTGARRLGGIRIMDAGVRKFIEEWEVEAYRKQVAAASRSSGRVAGKVVIVTGAAQGFGLEISQDLFSQGASVVLSDMNATGASAAAEKLNANGKANLAIGLAINVADGASVAVAIHQVVRTFGGFDALVSNAGVLRAGSVKTQPEKDFDFVTSVNYKGYFVCVQKASPILSTQHRARPGYWSDIIQINSKSGLQGSNRNGAYAGGKFGGIGLTQSFALELVEDCIKVNAICPGNFFDGPLWSDPQNGLFAQYLRSGKVPGAKTIADVKKSYESKVPMGRGCTTPDVMKAIYYLLEQKYETGQAVPVTGGQVMLS